MTNYMVKTASGTGSSQICFTNPAKSGSGRISQKQIRYSPTLVIKRLLLRCVMLALEVSVNASGSISTLNEAGFSSLMMTSTSNKKKGKLDND